LLQNGKVLVVGGDSGANMYVRTYHPSAELYDPATGKFTPTGSLPRPASYDTATLLADGRVLLAGGGTCKDPRHCTNVQSAGLEPLLQAELYDPSTGKFTPTGSVAADSGVDTATLLPDGRVLIAGGAPTAELYDPSTGRFTLTGKTSAVNAYITATLLQDGKVLLTGEDPQGSFLAQLYDEQTGKFKTISLALLAGMARYEGRPIARYHPDVATLLKDGRVLLFENGYLETYDPATGRCADAGFISPAGEWEGATATLLPDGDVLFEGGALVDPVSGDLPNTTAAVLYNPSDGSVRGGSTQFARSYQTATLLQDGSVLIAGGQDDDWNALASAELYKP
jgi:hypothetical protein